MSEFVLVLFQDDIARFSLSVSVHGYVANSDHQKRFRCPLSSVPFLRCDGWRLEVFTEDENRTFPFELLDKSVPL